MRVIGIDPGQTTGYVDIHLNGSSWQVVDAQEITWDERFRLGPLLAGTPSDNIVGPPLPDYVVVEQFTLYAHKAQEQIGSHFPSARVIGTLEAYMYDAGIIDRLIFQPASVRSLVKIMPAHEAILTGSPHKRDAYQHARYFLVTHLRVV